jgi:hypothetical protein
VLDKNNDNCIDMPETDLGIDTLQKKMYSSLHKKEEYIFVQKY